MESSEAIVIVLILVLIAFVTFKSGKLKWPICDRHGIPDDPKDGRLYVSGNVGQDWRRDQNQRLDARTGHPNLKAGYGANQAPHPQDLAFRDRNGHYLPPSRIAEAEQNAWAPYSPYSTPTYDVKKGHSPGSDLTQQLGHYGESDWNQHISDYGVDARTLASHQQWAAEVGPHSRGAMTVDNMDEAVAMSMPRTGITAFRSLAVPQGPNALYITELDGEDQAEHFKKFYF